MASRRSTSEVCAQSVIYLYSLVNWPARFTRRFKSGKALPHDASLVSYRSFIVDAMFLGTPREYWPSGRSLS